MTAIRISTSDHIDLEGRWDLPLEETKGVVVFCHPHPRQGGTMSAPLMVAVTRHLVAAGRAVLRFNFRGVGGSGGTWDAGDGEVLDITAAVALASETLPDLPLGVTGWSFGAATSLRWMADSSSNVPWVGIAPPVTSEYSPSLPEPSALAPAPKTFILGDRDQFTSVADLGAYAESVGGTLEVLKGSDHFFYFREERVAMLIDKGLR